MEPLGVGDPTEWQAAERVKGTPAGEPGALWVVGVAGLEEEKVEEEEGKEEEDDEEGEEEKGEREEREEWGGEGGRGQAGLCCCHL